MSRDGLERSREQLRRYFREHRLDRYQRVHVFAFIAGGWTFNRIAESGALPNLATVVYDGSPWQERAPAIAYDRLRFPWFATTSIVIAGRGTSSVFLDFGTAYRTEAAGWPVSVPGTAPCGLSAVSGNSTRWPACSLAVVAFPPRGLRADETALRRPSGTTRPSDPSRLIVISLLVPR